MDKLENVINGLEESYQQYSVVEGQGILVDHAGYEYALIDPVLIKDALALLKMQKDTINELYALYDDLCKDIRQKYESDDVCGLCQYDGAYVGESGDWMNECPGFETNECFCMKNSIRKMCGKPLIEEP